MRTALDAPAEMLNQHDRSFVSNVREYGWHDTQVANEAEHPGFSYSTGFWVTLGFPEVIVFSLSSDVSHAVLWTIFEDVKAGNPPPIGRRCHLFAGDLASMLIEVDKKRYPEYLGFSRWFYGGDNFPCLQLVWPDRKNLFPWQDGVSADFAESQPDLSSMGWAAIQTSDSGYAS